MLQTLYFKFTAHPDSVYIFSTIGMEPWGRIGVGIGELVASVLILLPRSAWLGGLLAIGLMAGAIFMHLVFLGISVQGDGGALFGMAAATLICASYVVIHDRSQILHILLGRG